MSLQSAMAFIAACRGGAVSLAELEQVAAGSIRPALFDRAQACGYVFSEDEFEKALRLDVAARLAPARGAGPAGSAR